MKYLLFCFCLCATGGYAQSSEVSAGIHYSWVALAGGNASTSLVSAKGFGARASFSPAVLRRHVRLTASYTAFPRHRGKTPPVSALGVELHGVFNPDASIQPYAGIGIGLLRFSPELDEFPPCVPDQGCIDEGAAHFQSDTYTTVRPCFGVALPLTKALRVAGEFRMHVREDTGFNGSAHAAELTAALEYHFGSGR